MDFSSPSSRHIRKEELTEMKRIAREMARSCKARDLNSYFKLNIEFSQILSSSSGNRQLQQFLNNLGKQVYRFRFNSLSIPGRMKKSNEYHQLLVRSIERKDEDAATEHSTDYNSRSRRSSKEKV